MRPLPSFAIAYIALGLQVGIARYVAIHGASPNLALLAVLFIALHARRNVALFSAFFAGLAQDLLTLQQPGLFALSYGLFAMLVLGVQQLVRRTHPVAHLSLALVGGLIVAFVLLTHSWLHPAAHAIVSDGKLIAPAGRIAAGPLFTAALYTALLAPLALWALGRCYMVFAFQGRWRR